MKQTNRVDVIVGRALGDELAARALVAVVPSAAAAGVA